MKKLAESDMYFSMLEGLSYADLLDFGDGTERLALAYRADWLLDGWTVQGDWAHAYIFEIWEYDEDADSISKIPSYDGNPMEVSTRGWQGFSEVLSPVRQAESGNQYVAIEVEESSSVDSRALADADYVPRAMSGKAYYGLNEGGVFGHLVTLESNEGPGEPNPIYQIDGKVVSETEYAKAAAPFSMSEASDEVAPAFSRASDQVTEEQAQAGDVSSLAGGGTPADTKQQTLDTIEELRSRIEASAQKDGDAAEAKDAADAKKGAAAQTVSAQAKTVDEAVTVPNYGRDLANPSDELVEWTYVSFDPAMHRRVWLRSTRRSRRASKPKRRRRQAGIRMILATASACTIGRAARTTTAHTSRCASSGGARTGAARVGRDRRLRLRSKDGCGGFAVGGRGRFPSRAGRDGSRCIVTYVQGIREAIFRVPMRSPRPRGMRLQKAMRPSCSPTRA